MKKEDLYRFVNILTSKKSMDNEKDVDFLKLVEIANYEFLASALFYQLNKNDFFKKNNDQELFLYLNEIFKLNTERNTQIVEQLKEIVSLFNSAGIECLLLKGCASLVENDYEHIGIRFLSDIDIMVHTEQIEEAYTLLMDAGYTKIDTDSDSYDDLINLSHHLCPVAKEGMPVVVELHRRVMANYDNIGNIPFSAETSYKNNNFNFSNAWVLNPTYKLYHTFLHTEYTDDNYNLKRLDLRHLYDFTILANKYYDKVDWNELYQLVKSLKLINNLQAYLYMCKELFGLTTPLTAENKKVHSDYKKVIKSFELLGTIRGQFYPLLPKLKKSKRIYSNKRLKKIYHYKNNIYHPYYILKHFVYQLQTYVFCKGCL